MVARALILLVWHQRATAIALGQQSKLSLNLLSHIQPPTLEGHSAPCQYLVQSLPLGDKKVSDIQHSLCGCGHYRVEDVTRQGQQFGPLVHK